MFVDTKPVVKTMLRTQDLIYYKICAAICEGTGMFTWRQHEYTEPQAHQCHNITVKSQHEEM